MIFEVVFGERRVALSLLTAVDYDLSNGSDLACGSWWAFLSDYNFSGSGVSDEIAECPGLLQYLSPCFIY